jgi:hypothetical protein
MLQQQTIVMKSRKQKKVLKFWLRRWIICLILFVKYPAYKAIASYALNSRDIPQYHQACSGKAALSQVLYQSQNNSKPNGESY